MKMERSRSVDDVLANVQSMLKIDPLPLWLRRALLRSSRDGAKIGDDRSGRMIRSAAHRRELLSIVRMREKASGVSLFACRPGKDEVRFAGVVRSFGNARISQMFPLLYNRGSRSKQAA